ncbi:MAG: hypothetical protein HEQ13_24725 [Dolichospermum sp. DEX189]|nr:hypothetical protein [Dolichospermum sp. DEX189]
MSIMVVNANILVIIEIKLPLLIRCVSPGQGNREQGTGNREQGTGNREQKNQLCN